MHSAKQGPPLLRKRSSHVGALPTGGFTGDFLALMGLMGVTAHHI